MMSYLEAYLNQISEKFRLTSVAARAGSQDARGEFERVWKSSCSIMLMSYLAAHPPMGTGSGTDNGAESPLAEKLFFGH